MKKGVFNRLSIVRIEPHPNAGWLVTLGVRRWWAKQPHRFCTLLGRGRLWRSMDTGKLVRGAFEREAWRAWKRVMGLP